jgi:serine/threonine protein kinase/Flp pilus assembly protein TadD
LTPAPIIVIFLSEKRVAVGEDLTKTLKTEMPEVRVGQTISGKFRISREIGQGGMGIVYEAEDMRLKRMVALKFLPAHLTRDPEARDRFIQEAQAASGLDHPNICTIYEIGETEAGEMYIAMAYYKGESLKDKSERILLPPFEVIDVAVQVAEGLAKAHEQGIVHRDIKPGNIFATSDGTVKILDFGLAKLTGQMGRTLPGTAAGTVAYMSPEQVRGENIDARTDIWSLGVVLYEMVTGGLPFRGEKDRAVFNAILNTPPLPAKELRHGFPAEVGGIIRRALAKDPAKRFVSAREMADALLNLKDVMAIRGRPSARLLSFGVARRKLMIISAASLFSLTAVGAAVWFLTRPTLAFEKRDKLMVSDVDNQTGDKVFDLALRTAIEAALQQSPYAAIFDRPQIDETLRLMRMDPGSRIDESIGYDICRFAGVRAFVLPRILNAGEAYELQAILIDPLKRRHVDRIRVTAKGREAVLLNGIDKLAQQLRSRLGESLLSIEKANKSVVEVTTSSWDALNYFSLALAKRQTGNYKEAATLMELALEKDPQFVDARSQLAVLDIHFLGQLEKGKDLLRQALKDAEHQNLPQRDILKLRALNKWHVNQDFSGALEEYRLMRELFPDFDTPWNNSGMILRSLGRYDEAVAMFKKAAELAPRNIIPLQNLWFTELDFLRDAKAAESVALRMVALSPEVANSHVYLGFSLAAQGRFEEAEKELRKTVELEPNHPYGLPDLAHTLLASGKAAEAVPIYRKTLELVRQGRMFGTVAKNKFDLALALRESGNIDEAKKVAAGARESLLKTLKGSAPGAQDLVMIGQLAIVIGQTKDAAEYLNKALALGPKDPDTLLDIAELRALLGQKELAIATLKKVYDAGYIDYFFPLIIPGFQPIRNSPEFKALYKLDK